MHTYSNVDEFLADLTEERKQQVVALQKIIKAANSKLTEHIKWNSPSYVFEGEDRITFNMHYPDQTMILLHMGATRKEDKKGNPVMQDASNLIKWSSDIRGALSFKSLAEIEEKEESLKTILRDWLLIK